MLFPSVERDGCTRRHLHDLRLPRTGQTVIGLIHTLQCDDEGNLYLSDELNHSVVSLNSSGELRWQCEGRGIEPGQFIYPKGISCGWLSRREGKVGCLAVADSWNRRVQFFDLSGNFIEAWSSFKGLAFSEIADVRYIALTPANSSPVAPSGIWLFLDRGNHCIYIYDTRGAELQQLGRCLSPVLARRWSLPGIFAGPAFDYRQDLSEFESLDYLYYPTRLFGHSLETLYVWEPYSRELKKLMFGQLIPVSNPPENLTEWIKSFDTGLLGWDANSRCLLLCGLSGELQAEVAIPGAPVVSNFPAGEVWIQNEDRLECLHLELSELAGRDEKRSLAPQFSSYIAPDTDEDPVFLNLLKVSDGLAELADEVLQLHRTDPVPPGVEQSILKRLRILISGVRSLRDEMGIRTHSWSIHILRNRLAALYGDGQKQQDEQAIASCKQWQVFAECLKDYHVKLLHKSDSLFAALPHKYKYRDKESISDSLRLLMWKIRMQLYNLLSLCYRFGCIAGPIDLLPRISEGASCGANELPCLRFAISPVSLRGGVRILSTRVLLNGFQRPGKLAFTSDGALWIIDFKEKTVYRTLGRERCRFGTANLIFPSSLIAVADGVAVADRVARGVWHIRSDGSCSQLLEFSDEEVMALASGGPDEPRYMATYNPQSGHGRIVALDAEWRIVGQILKIEGNDFGMPADLAALPNGNLVVVNWAERDAAWVITSAGEVKGELTARRPLPQDRSIARAVCAAPGSGIFVSDSRSNCVRFYDQDFGERLLIGRGVLSDPTCLIVRGDSLLVSNAGRGEVLELELGNLATLGVSDLLDEK